ncbi:MAG: TauD/TfdA family dioxygenase [Gammaproteobacteria bacterium]|nr:TauD/TfdA family dioxygenase [Gammaproteobacteria bacterium]
MNITPLAESFAFEVTEVDIASEINEKDFSAIQNTFHNCGVMLFRDQQLSEKQHIDFSRRFGPLEIHIARQYLLEGHPEIVVLSNKVENGKALGIEDAGRFWHSDLSYMHNPSLGSLLYALQVPPPEAGGNTPYASMYAAYDALDDSMKERLKSLRAVHSYEQRWQKDANRGMQRTQLDDNEREMLPEVSHPIVRPHPITGRNALYINEGFTVQIEGLTESESQALLDELFAHSTQQQFVYTHNWRAGDLIMWDNACVVHSASWYDPAYTRHLHRTTIAGPA